MDDPYGFSPSKSDYSTLNNLYMRITNHFSNKKIGLSTFFVHSIYFSLYLLVLVNDAAINNDIEAPFSYKIVPEVVDQLVHKTKTLRIDSLQIETLLDKCEEVNKLSLKMTSKING